MPLHWVFVVKHDLRHEARLIISGHATTTDDLGKYGTTTSLNGVKLDLFLPSRCGKEIISDDISSAYLNGYGKEKSEPL